MNSSVLSEKLSERVLERLGFDRRPDPTPESLRALYAEWCRRVPFDNVRKLIHVRSGNSGPLPGSTATDFLENWLQHGTGGTCWSGAGACHALLRSLGFDAARVIGTMMVAPNLPPNHGSVRVRFEAETYLVDCSILHNEPLRLDEHAETEVPHPAWGVRCSRKDGRWFVSWRPLHKLEGLDCRLEDFGLPHEEFARRHEQTRAWSPFNYQTAARLNRDSQVVGIGFGNAVVLDEAANATSRPVSHEERNRFLIETIGISEEMVEKLPADIPTPPPPGSNGSNH